MDFHSMTRKGLQALCKKHNLPANGTNLKMADALSALLNQAPEEIKTSKPSCLKGSSGEYIVQVAELDLVDQKAVPREPKKVRFLLQDENPDEELPHGKRKVGRISSQIRHEAEENGVKSRKKESDKIVEEELEMLVRTTRSRARESLVGDVTQFPMVGKRKTRNGCESELNEEKGNLNKVKAMGKVGESLNGASEIKEDWKNFGHPSEANELTEIDAQPDKVIRRSKRNVSKLAVSAEEVGRVPVESTVEDEDNGMENRNRECGAAVEEEQEMLVRATRSRTRKSLVGHAIQFPIVEKRKTRYESRSEINIERNVNGDREEKKKLIRVIGKKEVGESSDRFGENDGDLKKSGPLGEANELEIHAQPDKGMRRSRRNASKLAASAPADAEKLGDEAGRIALQSTVGSEGTGVKSGRKECNETQEKEQEMLVRTTRSHAQKLLAGDVTQFPIVEKKKTRKGSELEIDEEKEVNGDREEKKKRGRAKAMRGVGEISDKDCENGEQKKSGPRRGENELAEMPAQPDNGTRRSKRNISKLAASAPADTEMPKDEVARVPSKIMVEAQETRVKSRKMESDETVMEKQEKLVRATRSCSQKSVVGDVTQFPIVEKRRTRKGTELQTDKESNVNGNGEEKRNLSKVKTKWEVGKNSKDGEIEATQMHSRPEKATRRSKRNVLELAVYSGMEKDEIVTEDEPRKGSRNKILEVVDSIAECGTGFDNETEVTEETVAENRTRVENDLEAVDELQGQLKSTNGNGHRKRQKNFVVADGAAVGGPKRSKCPISSSHHGRSFAKVAEGEFQRNSMSAREEAAEISITDELFDPEIENLSRNYTDCGLTISVDGMVVVDSKLDTAEVVDIRSGTTGSPTELSHRRTEVVDVAKGTEAVSACKGDGEISGAEDVRIIPQVNRNEVVELAQIQEADPEVAREASGTILDAGKVDLEVGVFGDSLEHNQEKGAEEFAHVRDIGILLQFDCKETQLATPVSIASCLHDVSHIDVNDNQGNTIPNVLEMAEEYETMKSPSSGQQVSFGDDGLASCAHVSPECVVEYHGAFDHKDQLEFTDGSDEFVRTVLGDCKVTPNENGFAHDCSEESDHDCAQEENSFPNGVCNAFSEGVVETAMPELGFAEIEEFDAGYKSTQTISKQCDSKSGIEYGEDTKDTTGQFQEASETVIEDADQGCETDMGPSDIGEESKERNVRTVVENGGNMNAQGNEKLLIKYDGGGERFENSVAFPSHLHMVEECRTDEKLSSGRKIYLGDDGLASCIQITPESVAEHHRASDHKSRIIDGFAAFAEMVTFVRGDCEVIPNENGITQGIAGGSDHEENGQEESAVLNEIFGVEYGSTQIVSEQCDAKSEGNGDDAKDTSKEEFHKAPETIMEDVDWIFKIGMELKVINQEADERNEKSVEDNAGDVDEKENAEVYDKYDGDERRSENSVASPNLLDMVEEYKTVENPLSGQKINLKNDGLVTSTHITPEGVVGYHCTFGHKDQLQFAGVVDGFAKKVTHELIHGDFEVIFNENGISKGNTEKSDCEDAREENASTNEISGVEYGSTLTISEHCDSKGSEENGDDVRNIHSVVSEEFQEAPENIMDEVDGGGCKTGVELNDNCKVEERNVKTVEDITGDADEKENVVMLDKYEDDESFGNFVANPNLSDIVEECNTVEKSSSSQKIVVGDDGLSSFTKIVVENDGLAKICTPVSELRETLKPELGSVKLEEISLECRSVQTISKESDADGAEENGDDAKDTPGVVLVEFQEVSKTARTVADQDCKVDAELEDNSGNVEKRNATTIEVEGEDAYEKENAESFIHNYCDHEKSENSVAVTHQKSEVLDSGRNAEMVAFGVCAFSPLGAPKPQDLVADSLAGNEKEPSRRKILSLEKNGYGVSDREVRVTDTTSELSSEATSFFSDHDVREDAVKFVQGTLINAEEVEDEPSLNCVGAEAKCENAQEVSETNENKSSLQEEVREASDATDSRLEHQVEVVARFALEKLECEDHDETVKVKGQEEGFMSDEEGKTMENIQKEECIEVMNKTSKDKSYEDTRNDILHTEDHQLLHEDNCEEIKKRENDDCKTGNFHCNREVICLKPEEPLEVQGANKMAVDMFALGTAFLASVNAPEFQDCLSSKKQSTAFGSHASPNVNAMGLDVENFNLTSSECIGINQEEVPGTSILAEFGCENYLEEGSANSLRGTMIAVDPVENKSPVISEAAEMSGEEAKEVSGSKEIGYSFWKEIGEASNFKGTPGELETEKMKGSSELVLEELGNNSFEEVTMNEEVEEKDGFSCDYTQVVQENECFEAMEKELKCRAHNLIDKEMASILGDEFDEFNYDDSKEYSERENPESEIKNSDCKESKDPAPVKPEDPLELQGLEEMNADVGAVGILYVAPSGGAEYEASYTNFEEQSSSQMLLPTDSGEEESTEIQVTELPDKLSSKSTDCTNENYDSEVEGSLVDEAEATPVSTGEEEHLADSSRLEISVSFETIDVMCEKGSSEHEEEPDTVSALKETVEEGLVSANFKESLESEVMAQFTEEKEIVDILEGKFDSDDAKDVAGDNGSVQFSPQKFDFAGSEGVFLPKVALAPNPDEDFKDPTEFMELQFFAETSSSLQHELGADNCFSPLTALEHLVSGNEHERELASIVDAAANITSPMTDSSHRNKASYVCKEQKHDGQEENGNTQSSLSRHAPFKDVNREATSNLIGSGNLEIRVGEISSLLNDTWISTVQAEKRTRRIGSQKLKVVESLKLSSEMKENTPVVKQVQLSDRSLGKSATSVCKRRALQDLKTVKEQ